MKRPRTPTSPYVQAEHMPSEMHPVDAAVERLLPQQKALRRRIRRAADRLVAALGDQEMLWLALEELLAAYNADREEAFFNLGYEHGAAAARAAALRGAGGASVTDADAVRRDLAVRVRELAIQAGVPLPLTLAPLLEAAWTIAITLADAPITTHRRGP